LINEAEFYGLNELKSILNEPEDKQNKVEEQLRDEIHSLQTELSDATQKNLRNDKLLEDLSTEIKLKENIILEISDEIIRKDNEIVELNTELFDATEKILKKDKLLEDLSTEIKLKEKIILEISDEIKRKDMEIIELNNKLMEEKLQKFPFCRSNVSQ